MTRICESPVRFCLILFVLLLLGFYLYREFGFFSDRRGVSLS
jgi:hypothetical protein